MRRSILMVPALLAFGALTMSCGGSDDGGSGGIARVDGSALITVITGDDAKVLDPHTTSDGGNVKVIKQIYETLIRVNANDVGILEPALATEWSIADDALSIRFTLREGVTFHDGAAFDADAAKLSLDRLRVDGFELLAAPYAPEFSEVAGFDANGMTLTMRLNAPVARVALRNLSMFCASIVSPRVLEATRHLAPGAATAYVTQNAAGTGAFRKDSFDAAAKVTRLVAFEDYWNGAPQVKTVIFKSVADESTRNEFLTKSAGNILVDDVPRQNWDATKKSTSMTLHAWWALNICYLGVSATHEATQDPDVRRAIQLAISRAAIIDHYEGTARPTYSLVAQPLAEYDPTLRVEQWSDDLAERQATAAQLIEKAGAKGRRVTIYFPQQPRPYLPRPQDVADTVRQQLKAIGLDARIQGEDKNVLFPGVVTGKYELILIGWSTDNGDPDNFYGPLADGADGKPSANNTSRAFDPGVHAALLAARQIGDPTARVTAYRAIERRLQNDVRGYVPLVNTQQAVAYSKTIKGFVIDGFGQYRFDEASLE